MNSSVDERKPVLRGTALVREAIRGEIVSGLLPPDASLPSYVELARRFAVSNVTVQQALSQLAGQGFLDIRPRVGTFVSAKPPHLNTYALVFCPDPALHPPVNARLWTRYHAALSHAASGMQQRTGKRLVAFHGIDQHVDSEDRERLIGYLEAQRLAGVIFTSMPMLLHGSPIVELPGIPRVALGSQENAKLDSVVSHGSQQWYAKALDWLMEQGRRRVATLGLATPMARQTAANEDAFDRMVAERGMVSPPRWRQLASIRNPDSARRIVDLLMHDREPPDGLLICDDNFVEPALAGVSAVGAPGELAIVAHANFPLAPSTTMPVRFLGYDTNAVLDACLEIIDRRRRGESTPATVVMPPLWADECHALVGSWHASLAEA